MKKIYASILNKRNLFLKYSAFALLLIISNTTNAQVDVTASAGSLTGTYATLGAAFTAINSGIHQGVVSINLNAATIDEGTVPATLNNNAADPANYTSVSISTTLAAVTLKGNPAAGYGVIQLYGTSNVTIDGGATKKITIQNYGATTFLGSSVIRVIVNSTTATLAKNITIKNCILEGNVTGGNNSGATFGFGPESLSYGIYIGGGAQGLSNIAAPASLAANNTIQKVYNAGGADAMAPAGSSVQNITITNNSVNAAGRAIFFNGQTQSVGSNLLINNNTIGAGTIGAKGVYVCGILVNGTADATITNNTIQNIASYLSDTLVAIRLDQEIGGGDIFITGNTITNVISNAARSATGIAINSADNDFDISANIISGIKANIKTYAIPDILGANGIIVNAIGGTASVYNNKINDVSNAGNTGRGQAAGIRLLNAANGASVYNNFISKIMQSGSPEPADQINPGNFVASTIASGILIEGGSFHLIAYNSINLYGAMPGATPGRTAIACLSIASVNNKNLTIKNNIFSNTTTSTNANSALVGVFLPFNPDDASSANANSNIVINNNAYYTGTATSSGMGYAGPFFQLTNVYRAINFDAHNNNVNTNWRYASVQLGTLAVDNDDHSFGSTAAAPFVSATDLHIPNSTTTGLESGGIPVGISTDIDAQARSGTWPDIGADEFTGTKDDKLPPYITYTKLSQAYCSPAARTLAVTIKDPSGIGTGAGAPLLYWRVVPSAVWTAVSAGPPVGNVYTFNFGAGVTAPNTVEYYVVAQDGVTPTANVGVNPSLGTGNYTSNPPAISIYPNPPNFYVVGTPLAPGTYLVGVGQPSPFNTLEGAINKYNTSCLSGAVIFELNDANYNVAAQIEIFNSEASATNTLTIKPNKVSKISGNLPADNAIFKLNGADYIIFDGAIGATTTPVLTIENLGAGSALWIASNGISNGATNNTIKNTIVKGKDYTSFSAIVQSSGVQQGQLAESLNSNNTYSNNLINSAYYGIALVGGSTHDVNNKIQGNTVGSATPANYIKEAGIWLGQQQNVLVEKNEVLGISTDRSSTSADPSGAVYVAGTMSGGKISKNKIHFIRNTRALGYSIAGIALTSGSTNTALEISNNFIWDVATTGWSSTTPTWSGSGINISKGGGGYKIYYNSVVINTDETNPTYVNGINTIAFHVVSTSGTALDVRSNIFANLRPSGSLRFAVYVNQTSSVFGTIDYNDYYSLSPNFGYLNSQVGTIGAWRAATGKDVHSVNINPLFINVTEPTTNLHVQPASQLNHAGAPIAGITTDIDDDVRTTGAGGSPTAPDIGADEFVAPGCSNPIGSIFTATINKDSICVSETINVTGAGYPYGEGMIYNWQTSPYPGAIWTDIPGATTPSSYSGNVSSSVQFRLRVTCGVNSEYSKKDTVIVNNPAILTRTPGTRCGFGTVNLAATADPGLTINWYEDASTTVSLHAGNTYSPIVNATTTFYVSATAGGITGTVGLTSPSAGSDPQTQTTDWEVYFDVIQPTTLQSIDIYPLASGQPYILYLKNSSGAILATYNITTNVSGGSTPQTIPINYSFAATGTGFYLDTDLPPSGVTRNNSGASYPYTSSAINITGNGFINSYYIGMYNWKYSSGCTSNRLPVVATVTAAPAVTIAEGSSIDICAGSDTTLHVSGTGYTTYLWSLTPGGATIYTGAAYTVNPSVNTTYYVVGETAAGQAGCRSLTQTTINVKPTPTDLSLSLYPTSTDFCYGQIPLKIVISGGVLDGIVALGEDFNGATNDWVTTTQSTGGTSGPNFADWTLRPDGYTYKTNTFHSNDSTQFYLSNPDAAGSGVAARNQLTSPAFSLQYYTEASLTFYNYYRNLTSGDYVKVEISTDGGTTWNPTPLRNINSSRGSYTNFVLETIDLAAYLGQTNLKIRWNYTAGWAWYYALDNVKVSGKQQLEVTWTPDYQIFLNYTDYGTGADPRYLGNIPYVPGTNAPTVYVQPFVDTTYTAIVTSLAGCSKSKDIFVNTVNNAVSVTNTTPVPPLNICQKAAISLSSTGVNAGTNPNSYSWVNVDNGAVIGYGANINVNTPAIPLASGHYTVISKLTSNVTCATGNPAVASDTLRFTIDSIYAISATITSDVPTICAGGSVTFTAVGTNTGVNPGYQWQINGVNVTGETNSTFTTTALNPGDVVRVVMTSDEKCTYGQTTNSNPITITVNPILPVSASIAASPGVNICAGTNVTFTATPTNGGGTPSYQWWLNGVALAGETNSTYTTNTLANNDQVYVVLTSSETCQSGGPATSNTLTIVETGSVPVSVSLSYPGAPGPICGSGAITYTATGVNPGITPSYVFSVNGTPVQTSSSNTFSTSVANGDVVSVQLTSSLSCATGNPATSTLPAATVTTIPAAPVVTPAGPLAICAGSSATLTSSITSNILWSPGSQTTSTISVNAAGSYSVTQTVGGCTSASSNVVVVTIKPLPATPTITPGGPTTFCAGGNVTLTSSLATGGATYLWSNGATTQSISATTAGTYTVQLVLNGCNSVVSNSIAVTVNATPVVTITGGTNFCGAAVLLTANVAPGGGTITGYQWYLGGSAIAGATSSTYSATAIGNYTVTATNNTPCTSAASPTHTIVPDASPMIGIYTISTAAASCTNFQSFKTAIDALNTRTIAGNVTFNVTPGFVEPALSTRMILGSTNLNASVGAYTIIFRKNGAGVNPLINSYVGTNTASSATPDGIWAIAGTDNVTIDGIDLKDNNTTNPAAMEFGFGLFKLSVTDGVNNATIKNCVITMSRVNDANGLIMAEGAKGILVTNSTPTAAITALVPTSVNGSNSNIKIYTNTINFGQHGIALMGYNASSPTTFGDTNNDIGGSSAATGNTILNFGSTNGSTTLQANGIRVTNQWNINISYNTINNNNGAGNNYTGPIRGIFGEISPSVGYSTDANSNVNYNTVTIKSNATTQSAIGIDFNLGMRSSSAVTNTVNINHNLINNCDFLSATSGAFYAISGPSGGLCPYTVNINDNEIANINLAGTSGQHYIIYGGGGSNAANAPEFLFTNNNNIHDVTKTSASSANFRVITTNVYAINNWTADGNIIDNIINNSTSTFDGILALASYNQNSTFTNNIVRNIYTNSTATIYGIRENGNVSGTKLIANNQVYNFFTSAGGVGGATFNGITSTAGNTTVENNIVHSLNSTGTTGGTAGLITGIQINGTSVDGIVRNNKVYDLSSTSTRTSNLVAGLYVTAANTVTIYNNYISDLRAPNANTFDAIRGISFTNTSAANTANNLYYNTVYLDATATSVNFGSSAIFATLGVTPPSSAPLNMRNNIFVNNSVANGTGATVAYRRNGGSFANYVSTSDNNLFYAGVPGAKNLIFSNGTNYQTLAAYKTIAAPADQNSITFDPVFVNTTTAPYDLHLDVNYNCGIEGAGNNAGILIPTDFDGDARQVVSPFKTDIGADEFNGPVGGPFTWIGVNSNWEDKANWCAGVPDASSAVVIPAGKPNYPILTSLTNKAGTIVIDANASITITTGVLTVSGATFTVNGTLTNDSLIVFNGTMPQTFPIGTGTIAAMDGLEVNNTSVGVGSGVTFDKAFNIEGVLKPTKGNINLNNVIVTLKSTATRTAQVSALGAGVNFNYTGAGKFSVENFIKSAGRAAWRFISVPTNTTQTIYDAWQEGGISASTGYGMQIVGPNSAGPGFDVNNSLPSLKTYNPAANNYITVPGTMVGVNSDKGYLAFVRGDRSMVSVGPTNNTNLRTQGAIKTGTINVTGNSLPDKFISVGNPYPSALDFTAITKTTGIAESFYVWDPKMGGNYGYGKWQTIAKAPGNLFTITPGGGSYDTTGLPVKIYIESGQAFMVYATPSFTGPAYSITMHETDKASGSNNVTRPVNSEMKSLITRLFQVTGTERSLVDGVRIDFDNSYSTAIDVFDAAKANNSASGLGIITNGKTIAVERRPELVFTDTIRYENIALPGGVYQFDINPVNISNPVLEAFLEDTYLNTKTRISLDETQRVNFTVDNVAGSAAPDRFRIVFEILRPVPVSFTRVEAVAVEKDVRITWSVENEINIRNYNVERSVDGRHFVSIATVEAGSRYDYLDVRPGTGKFFYRIRSNDVSGEFKNSNIVSAQIGSEPTIITVYPNPIKDNRVVKISINSSTAGDYQLKIVNQVGQTILTKRITHPGGKMVYDVQLGQFLSRGSYNLQIVDPEKTKTIYKIVY